MWYMNSLSLIFLDTDSSHYKYRAEIIKSSCCAWVLFIKPVSTFVVTVGTSELQKAGNIFLQVITQNSH